MKDRSKPPGPNPRGGYWEWDDESQSWEIEDYRRKKRQIRNNLLRGRLQCGAGTIMHIVSVTLGFSIDNMCRPPRPTCQATSVIGRQVAHCEGKMGGCDVAVQQQFLYSCGRRTNFARIKYECIPGSQGLTVPYVRAVLEAGEGDAACGEDMLLLDTWDVNINRFTLKEELCGMTAKHDVAFNGSEVKLTYIPSSTKDSNGFLMRLQGEPNAAAADTRPRLPPNFDIRKYPGLLNRTLAAWRERMGQQQQGSAANQVALDYGNVRDQTLGDGENVVTEEGFNVSGTSGTLSAVVASLASVIVIMGSIGMYMWYTRSQRKNHKSSSFFRSFFRRNRSTVRSTTSIYTESPIYHDPDGPTSNIPTTISACIVSETGGRVPQPQSVSNSLQGRSLQTATSGGDPPALPRRPPRTKKETCRRLPSEETVVEEVEYDNAGGDSDVKVVEDIDYASLNEISNALGSQDTEIQTDA
nr:hypothetical protein BaRGS_025539 [Batillaria attramentaria]